MEAALSGWDLLTQKVLLIHMFQECFYPGMLTGVAEFFDGGSEQIHDCNCATDGHSSIWAGQASASEIGSSVSAPSQTWDRQVDSSQSVTSLLSEGTRGEFRLSSPIAYLIFG